MEQNNEFDLNYNCKNSNLDIFEILNLRTYWEELAEGLNVNIDSSLSGLKLFIKHSGKSNRFKKNWPEAMKVANLIIGKN